MSCELSGPCRVPDLGEGLVCASAAAKDCDDGNGCTVDACGAGSGACTCQPTFVLGAKKGKGNERFRPKPPGGSLGAVGRGVKRWMGVSVENANYTSRIDHLRTTGAAVKFLSIEPLLGPIPQLDVTGIDWVIVGGESGRTPRPLQESWVLEIMQQCQLANVPFFFKQWGGVNKKAAGRQLLGETWYAMPVAKEAVLAAIARPLRERRAELGRSVGLQPAGV